MLATALGRIAEYRTRFPVWKECVRITSVKETSTDRALMSGESGNSLISSSAPTPSSSTFSSILASPSSKSSSSAGARSMVARVGFIAIGCTGVFEKCPKFNEVGRGTAWCIDEVCSTATDADEARGRTGRQNASFTRVTTPKPLFTPQVLLSEIDRQTC